MDSKDNRRFAKNANLVDVCERKMDLFARRFAFHRAQRAPTIHELISFIVDSVFHAVPIDGDDKFTVARALKREIEKHGAAL